MRFRDVLKRQYILYIKDLTWFDSDTILKKLGLVLFFGASLSFPNDFPSAICGFGTDVSQVGPLDAALDDARGHLRNGDDDWRCSEMDFGPGKFTHEMI